MTRGTVVDYDDDREQGYIEPDDDHDRIPFDKKSLVDFKQGERPRTGDRVSFEIEGGMAGLWARNVRRVESRRAQK